MSATRRRDWLRVLVGITAGTLGLVLADMSRVFLQEAEFLRVGGNLLKALAAVLALFCVLGFVIGLTAGILGLAIVRRLRERVARRLANVVFYGGTAVCLVFLLLAVGTLFTAPDGLGRRLPEPGHPPSAGDRDRPNVLLVIADSLRQDALETDIAAELAPNIMGFAAQATTYTAGQAPSSWTVPSVKGIITGRYPSELGGHEARLPNGAVTVAELLYEGGYATAGISDNHLNGPVYGLAQGYEYFWNKNDKRVISHLAPAYLVPKRLNRWLGWNCRLIYRGAAEVNAAARRWLTSRQAARPFFLTLHYMDVHYPYVVYENRPGNYSNRSTAATRVRYYEVMLSRLYDQKPPFAKLSLPSDQIDDFRYRYFGSLQYLDEHVGALFRLLKEAGLWDNTLVIFTADHGEEFFEHHYFSHGAALYQESIRVPLIVKSPGQRPDEATTLRQPVSLLQIVPTILDVTGTNTTADFPYEPLPRNTSECPGLIRSEHDRHGVRIFSVQLGKYKRMHSRVDNGREYNELYDTTADPRETTNLLSAGRTSPAEIDAALGTFIEQMDAARAPGDEPPLPEELVEALRSLGYTD